MTDHPTLPGSIPGLLRRGSPVRLYEACGILVDSPLGLAESYGTVRIATTAAATGLYDIPPDRLTLDLADPTGRAHAAWWLTEHAELWAGEREHGVIWRRAGGAGPEAICVPALADLDPDDPRLLPDGSRWVDVEALRRVVLHVAGLAP